MLKINFEIVIDIFKTKKSFRKNLQTIKKMRKLLPLFLTVLSLTMFFGCGKEDLTIKSLSLDLSTLSLTVNQTHQFVVSITPTNLQAPIYTWTTSNNSIVSVDDKGEIKAISIGEATITVFIPDKTLQSSCIVSVQPINATGISLDVKSLELLIDEEKVLTYKITPDNTTNKQITWSSSDINIATVDNTGKVKAIGIGETKITAKTNNLIPDVCNIKVNPVKATSISLSQNSLSMEMSDKQSVNVSFTPVNTTNKKINWSSSNSTIATVSETGEITGVGEGTAIITAKSDDGGFTANCNVNVKLKGLILTKTTITTLPNQQELIWVKYSTSDAAYTHATWSSSNPTVAKVTGDGEGTNSASIQTNSTGTAVITATSADGTKIATCNVVVKDIKDFITLNVISQGTVIINGFITGNVYSQITNNSPQSIVLTSFYMYDGYSGALVAYSTDPTKLGPLASGASTNLGKKLNSVYYPTFKWSFTWSGNTYQVEHNYPVFNLFGAPKMNVKLNLISK